LCQRLDGRRGQQAKHQSLQLGLLESPPVTTGFLYEKAKNWKPLPIRAYEKQWGW
jgi:hypothetical protein